MEKPKTPEQILEHKEKYNTGAWRDYSLLELGAWVHNLHKRAGHRSDPQKKAKDLQDARNYWLMMGSWLDAASD